MLQIRKLNLNKLISLNWPALSMVFCYITFFSFISIMKYLSFEYYDFDLAVWSQVLYNLLNGSLESSILGIPFLGNHLSFIMFFLLPIYGLLKSPITLLIIQSLCLGFSGYFIYLIARQYLPKGFDYLLLFAYLFYPCIGYVNLYEFHPTSIATLFLSGALYFIVKDNILFFFVCIVGALFCQENISIILIFVGIFLTFIKKSFRWWLTTILIGIGWFLVGEYILRPYFGGDTIKYHFLYIYLGESYFNILKNILTHPLAILRIFFHIENINYLNQILGPVVYLPFLSPLYFLGAFPSLAQHMLSLRSAEHTIYYHYTAEIIPFVFFATVSSLRKILTLKVFQSRDRFFFGSFLFLIVGANIILGPHLKEFLRIRRYFKTELDFVKEDFVKKIPDDAEVVATFEFLPKLSKRKKLYSLHHITSGRYTLSDRPYRLSPTTEYSLIDFEDLYTFKGNFYNEGSGMRLRHLYGPKGSFGIVDMVNTIALFKKGTKGKYELFKVLSEAPSSMKRISGRINSDMKFLGYSVDDSELKDGIISFRFYWRCLQETGRVYSAFIDILNEDEIKVRRYQRFICYRVYPTNEWKKGQVIEEFYRVLLPQGRSQRRYKIKMGIYDFRTHKLQKIYSPIPTVVDSQMRINLADIELRYE